MASKQGGLREDLKQARRLEAKLKSNMQRASPDSTTYWQEEWRKARDEVRRLQRQLTS